MKYKLVKILVIVFLAFGVVNCDSNAEGGGGGANPNTSTPTDDVATNVGPVEDLVATDVLTKANEVRGSTQDYITEMTGGDDEPGTFLIKDTVNPNEEDSLDVDLSESISCDSGGSKDIIGSGTFTVDANQATGTFVGSFTIQYGSCQDIVALATSNGTCAITPTVSGDVAVTINQEFYFSSSELTPDVVDYTDVAASTSVALDVVVGTTDADQSYSFTYDLSTTYSSTNLNGIVSYSGSSYDMEDIENFILDSATTSICD